MERQDEGMAFLLQYENIAWFDKGKVRILDRRVYPEVRFVTCKSHQEVAQAITDMVTQSCGPYVAAPMGMALAAWECRGKTGAEQLAYLKDAAETISNARPTTKARLQIVCQQCYDAAEKAIAEGREPLDDVFTEAVEINNRRYAKIAKAADYLVDMMPYRGKVMTQCFAETILGAMLREIKKRNLDIKLFCPETRPYFQGARLTATVARDMGFDVTLITDNMPAFVMKNEGIDLFTSAADAICVDGHVVNKVGTYQIAIAAKYHGIPYFVSGKPEIDHPTIQSVNIEMRDPDFVLQAMGVRTAAEGVKGYYPSFDITPPHLVSGVATDRGIFSPYDLARYFDGMSMAEMKELMV